MTVNGWWDVFAVLVGLVGAGGGDDRPDRNTPIPAATRTGREASGSGEDGTDDPIEFRFLTGPLRWGIDHAPGIVIGVTFVLFATAEISPGDVDGVSALLADYRLVEPLASISTGSLIAVVAIWSAILLGIFLYARLIGLGDLLAGLVAYGVVIGLVVGTAVSVVLVLTSENPTQLRPNVVYTSGYLLMLLVSGWYIRRSMAYTEELMGNLEERLYDPHDEGRHPGHVSSTPPQLHDDASGPQEGGTASTGGNAQIQTTYRSFIQDLERDLQKRVGGIQLAHVFAVVVVLPSAYVWWFGSGPQNLGGPTSSLTAFLTYSANLAFDFVIAVVAFKFLVLIKYLHELTTESYPRGEEDSLRLLYDLRHPDGCAGLYDLGDFAMRVNLLLLIGGVYLVYRLYVQGLRALPPDMMVDLSFGGVPYNWIFGYVGPVFIFTAIAGTWLYYSFWQLHQKMARDRRRLLECWPDPLDDGHEHIRPDEPGLEEVREAPVWPIDNKQLIPLAVANAVPAAVVILEGFG